MGSPIENTAPMTPAKFTERMMKIFRDHAGDPENGHGEADDLLVELLRELGYEEGADIFKKAEKWYG